MSEYAMQYVAVACIFSAIIIIVSVLYSVFRGRATSYQHKPAKNPTTRSWLHIPDDDQPFPMLTPIDKDGHQGQKYYREKYRRLKLKGWIK